MTVDYVVTSTDEAISHHIDGELILAIPKGIHGATLASRNADIALKAAFVIVDVFFLIAAAMGVSVVLSKRELAPKLKGFGGLLQKVFHGPAAREMAELVKKEQKLEAALKVLKMISASGISVRGALTAFLDGMSWWQKALAVTQLVAAVALLVATAGGSLAKQVAQLVVAGAAFLLDVAALVEEVVTPAPVS